MVRGRKTKNGKVEGVFKMGEINKKEKSELVKGVNEENLRKVTGGKKKKEHF